MWEENHTTLKNNQGLMHMVAENPVGVWIANRKLWWQIMVAEKPAGVWIANRKSNSGVASAL